MNILVVAMPGCGNFGDDLISYHLIKHLNRIYCDATIGFLSGSIVNPYENTSINVIKFIYPEKRFSKYFRRKKDIIQFVKRSDLIFIGGGGLLQDSHNPFTPHSFLKWILFARCPILLVGIGIGPLRYFHNIVYLNNILSSKGITIQVRDNESAKVLKKNNVKNSISLGCDIVEGSNMDYLTFKNKNSNVLGCSIRPWPDINIDIVIDLLKSVSLRDGITCLYFFVFEYSESNTDEYEFQRQIMNSFSELKTEIFVYGVDVNFEDEFYSVSKAIASRYHANVLWQKANIPVLPIPYAPKVYSLYSKFGITIIPLNERLVIDPVFYRINIKDDYDLPELNKIALELSLFSIILIFTFNIFSFVYDIIASVFNKLFFLYNRNK